MRHRMIDRIDERMGGLSVLNDEWLTGWSARVETATRQALRDVVSTYPFEADDHMVGPPSSPAQLAALRDGCRGCRTNCLPCIELSGRGRCRTSPTATSCTRRTV